ATVAEIGLAPVQSRAKAIAAVRSTAPDPSKTSAPRGTSQRPGVGVDRGRGEATSAAASAGGGAGKAPPPERSGAMPGMATPSWVRACKWFAALPTPAAAAPAG